jgi:hypothetical protein
MTRRCSSSQPSRSGAISQRYGGPLKLIRGVCRRNRRSTKMARRFLRFPSFFPLYIPPGRVGPAGKVSLCVSHSLTPHSLRESKQSNPLSPRNPFSPRESTVQQSGNVQSTGQIADPSVTKATAKTRYVKDAFVALSSLYLNYDKFSSSLCLNSSITALPSPGSSATGS